MLTEFIGNFNKRFTNIIKYRRIINTLWIITVVIVVCYLMRYFNYNSIDTVQKSLSRRKLYENRVWCHYVRPDDALPVFGKDIVPASPSLFFIETSCRGDLDSRQVCAIESAAKANTNWNIYVLFASPVSKLALTEGRLAELKQFKNVIISRVYVQDFIKGTPLESLISNYEYIYSQWPVSHTSDVLRFLTLNKYGGFYLDLDVLVANPFDTLPKNFAARENDILIGTAVLAISKDEIGQNLSNTLVSEIGANFRGNIWTHNGPDVITRVLQRICDSFVLSEMSAENCYGFEVFGPQFFYPVHWSHGREYFLPGHVDDEAYTHHVWNKLTKSLTVHKDSPYAKLAKKLCPATYNGHLTEFGS